MNDAGVESTSRVGRLVFVISVVLALGWTDVARAEEGGAGHYMPGTMASFMDGISPTETLITRYNFLFYQGDHLSQGALPVASLKAFDVEAETIVNALTLFWRPSWGGLSEKWSYGMSASLPVVSMDVEADVEASAGVTVRRQDSLTGLGDLVVMPLMFNYNVNPDFNIGMRLSLYAPTGDYETGRLANTGKNFWTLEPAVNFIYLGQKNGREASLFAGVDFNQENPDTDYRSGTQGHLDATLAQHFPLGKSLAGAGATGHWYEQLEGDSGAGANLGAFEARTTGLGPVVSYVRSLETFDLLAELKWIHEFETQNRLQGDIVWFKLMAKF